MKERLGRDLALFVPAWNVVLPTATWDALFGAGSRLSQKSWYALSKFGVSGDDGDSSDVECPPLYGKAGSSIPTTE